jgi:hypothetical protein
MLNHPLTYRCTPVDPKNNATLHTPIIRAGLYDPSLTFNVSDYYYYCGDPQLYWPLW